MTAESAQTNIAVLVLGMHRSGTSATTRVLNLLGVELGNRLLPARKGNALGHWEHLEALSIHEQLLHDLDMSWDDTRPMPAGWTKSAAAKIARTRIAALIEDEFAGAPLWGIKDPRLCRLLPLWLDVLDKMHVEARALFVMRHPSAVEKSLTARDALDGDGTRLSWLEHFAEPESVTREIPRAIALYDDLLSDWKKVVQRVGKELGVEWPVALSQASVGVSEFLREGERHNLPDIHPNSPASRLAETLYSRCAAVARGTGGWSEVTSFVDNYRKWAPPFLADIARRAKQVVELAKSVEQGENEVRAKEVEVRARDELVRDQDRRLYGLLETVHGKDVHIHNREEVIRNKDSEIQRRAEIIHHKDAEIQRRDEIVRHKDAEIQRRDEIVRHKDAEIQRRDEVVRHKDAEIQRRDDLIAGKQHDIERLDSALREQTNRLRDGERRIDGLLQTVLDKDDQLRSRAEGISARNAEITTLAAAVAASNETVTKLAGELSEAQTRIATYTGELEAHRSALRALQTTLSWRITKPLRTVRRVTSAAGIGRLIRGLMRPVNKARHVAGTLRVTWSDPERRARYLTLARVLGPRAASKHTLAYLRRGGPRPRSAIPVSVFDLREGMERRAVILTTHHCDFVAASIQHALARIGVEAEIINERPQAGYTDLPHFVICPQMFETLPGLYVAFQMEQSVSTRWFTPDYIKQLENSFAILDYAIANIDALVEKGLHRKQFFYLPLGYVPDYAGMRSAVEPEYDVLFYGDINNERRRMFINALEKNCRVKVINDLFGEALHAEIAKARLVVNIHYYEGALLETTRLWECVSMGKLVVSERAANLQENGDLEQLVDFVDINDIEGMVAKVKHWLENEPARIRKLEDNRRLATNLPNRFEYFFYRFLLAFDNISFFRFWQLAGKSYKLPNDRLCLNLPEYSRRRTSFEQDNHFGFHVFPGLRHQHGWVGCGLSYKLMIMLARQARMPQVTICEDDVEFREGFAQDMDAVESKLAASREPWDVFSGFLGDLHADAIVYKVSDLHKKKLVLTDRLISMVLNVYNRCVYDRVLLWDERDRDVNKNTIDRYLEHTHLNVLVCHPFLVGHKCELHSTLWGVQNGEMDAMIQRSEQLLGNKIDEFISRAAA